MLKLKCYSETKQIGIFYLHHNKDWAIFTYYCQINVTTIRFFFSLYISLKISTWSYLSRGILPTIIHYRHNKLNEAIKCVDNFYTSNVWRSVMRFSKQSEVGYNQCRVFFSFFSFALLHFFICICWKIENKTVCLLTHTHSYKYITMKSVAKRKTHWNQTFPWKWAEATQIRQHQFFFCRGSFAFFFSFLRFLFFFFFNFSIFILLATQIGDKMKNESQHFYKKSVYI